MTNRETTCCSLVGVGARPSVSAVLASRGATATKAVSIRAGPAGRRGAAAGHRCPRRRQDARIEAGRTASGRSRFTTILVNVGEGDFILRATRERYGDWDGRTGRRSTPTSGAEVVPLRRPTLVWGGDGHDHWHVERVARSKRLVRRRRGRQAEGRDGQVDTKIGFCYYDSHARRWTDAVQKAVYRRHEPAGSRRTTAASGWGSRRVDGHLRVPASRARAIDVTDAPGREVPNVGRGRREPRWFRGGDGATTTSPGSTSTLSTDGRERRYARGRQGRDRRSDAAPSVGAVIDNARSSTTYDPAYGVWGDAFCESTRRGRGMRKYIAMLGAGIAALAIPAARQRRSATSASSRNSSARRRKCRLALRQQTRSAVRRQRTSDRHVRQPGRSRTCRSRTRATTANGTSHAVFTWAGATLSSVHRCERLESTSARRRSLASWLLSRLQCKKGRSRPSSTRAVTHAKGPHAGPFVISGATIAGVSSAGDSSTTSASASASSGGG